MDGELCIKKDILDWINEEENKLKHLSEKQYQLEYDLRSVKIVKREIENSIEKALGSL